MTRRAFPAAVLAILSAFLLVLLIFLGSRGFKDFDSALVGYAVATVFALAAIAYRYTLWITRPPNWRYFKGGWVNFLSWRNFRRYTTLIPLAWRHDIFGQTFILKRSLTRWVAHMSIFWGVLLSLAITLPLTFGWLRFTLVPPDQYQLWFFGLPVFQFPIEAGTGLALFHGLDFTALLLILGVGMALWRRINNVGLLTTQRFGFDLMPLVLLFAIAVTGLALTASSLWWQGKFFHIVQRPASIGVTLYQTVNQDVEHYR